MSGSAWVAVADTGRCNLASMMAALERIGADARVESDPAVLASAPLAVLPGVGAFGPVADRLRSMGMVDAFASRVRSMRPTLGACLGMQLFFEASDESPGARGIAALPGRLGRFASGLRCPQYGWNAVPAGGPLLAEAGWAYFANSYRLADLPAGWSGAFSVYGESFVAALEQGPILLCQFHPEISGDWGARLLARWLALGTSQFERGATLSPGADLGSGEVARYRVGTAADGQVLLNAAGGPVAPPAAGGPVALPAAGGLVAPPAAGGPARRIIPCLDVEGGRVVKGVRYQGLKDMGDPAELAARYEAEGADELVVLDITAGLKGERTAADVTRAVRAVMGIPLCMGGGIRTLADAERLLAAGADKVSINSRAWRDPELVRGIAREFGSQCCVVAVDAARGPDGVPMAVLDAGHTVLDESAVDWIRRAVDLGAGEILLTSRDRDGTRTGYDTDLLREAVAAAPQVPVIASGGAASPGQIMDGLVAGADAALLAGALHDGSLSIGTIKQYLRQNGVEVRIC
jgi:imidazole glycerol phosphate synthase glutamine amidotransferase subunit